MAKEKEKDKSEILAAAQEVLARKGIDQLTLEEVAKQLKSDVRQVKAAFASKEALLGDLISKDMEESTELFIRIINDRGKADIKLTRLVRELLTRYQKSFALFNVMSVGADMLPGEESPIRGYLRKEHIDRYRQNTAIIGRLVAQGQSENLFTDIDPLEAAYLLRGMISAALRYRTSTNKEDDMRDHADTIMRVFLKGLLR